MKINISNILLIIMIVILIAFGAYHFIDRLSLNNEINILKDKIEDVALRQAEVLDSFSDNLLLNIKNIRQDLANVSAVNRMNLEKLQKNMEYFKNIYSKFEDSLTAYSNAWNKIAELLGYDELRIEVNNE